MNKKVLDKLTKELLDLVNKTKDFSLKEIPEVAKEIIKFEGIIFPLTTIVMSILAMIALAVATYFLRSIITSDAMIFFICFTNAGIALVPIIFISDGVLTILKAKHAPRLFLIEYLKKLLK